MPQAVKFGGAASPPLWPRAGVRPPPVDKERKADHPEKAAEAKRGEGPACPGGSPPPAAGSVGPRATVDHEKAADKGE